MFVDVRNFTEMSKRSAPTAVVGFLNTLLNALSRHVTANEGTLDKFIGDSIMAFWNAPSMSTITPAKPFVRPWRCARPWRGSMLRTPWLWTRTEGRNWNWDTHRPRVRREHGSQTRFNYSAVGDAVNLASRIEVACKVVGFDILVSDETAKTLPGYALLDAGALPLRGKSGRTKLYAVVGDERIGSLKDEPRA
jgi:adenylate cyclase